MGAPHSQDFIEAVRNAGDIVTVISEYVPLKQAGVRQKGLCPFHQEKTPSFTVDADNQLFYCFGCQTGGDVFKFVQLYESVGFGEALELLADKFGVPVPTRNTRGDDPYARMLLLNRDAASFYQGALASEAGDACRAYLTSRGLRDETAKRLGVGYAPGGWETLLNHLTSKRYSAKEIEKAGLAVPRKSGSGQYDRFRDRLIFPIRDIQGRSIAFGGRTLGDDQPKYINSPESPTYTKGEHLYGMDIARDSIRREGFALIVEGYLDFAALYEAGFTNVVASLGTAFTPAQARLLARYTQRVTVSYDGDAAGAKATARSLDLLLEKGFEVRVVDLSDGEDPDDYIRKHGAESYARLVREAPAYIEFLVRKEVRARDLNRIEEKVAAIHAVLPHVAKLQSAIERAAWADRIGDALQIEDGMVMQELRDSLKSAQTTIRHNPGPSRPVRETEVILIQRLLGSEGERALCEERLDHEVLQHRGVRAIVETILNLNRAGRSCDYPTVLETLPEEADRDLLTEIAFRELPEDGPDVEDCLWSFEQERLQRQGREAVREVNRLQTDGGRDAEVSDVDRQLRELQQIARERDELLRAERSE
ncbi:MAG: DNA primase [Acidobacteriota bacterium]|nr:DNA primase [Acidobacteriota bacterium]MDH3784662.1 DNA primase [Acidobacteriota bacterium]